MNALLILSLTVPLLGLVPLLLLGPRMGARIALGVLLVSSVLAIATGVEVALTGHALQYFVAGLAPPLGIGLRVDGFSAAMMGMCAVVLPFAAIYAIRAPGGAVSSAPPAFFMLVLALACALNLAFMAQDLFTLYVALELITFAAVPLVCLDGKPGQLSAALTYLMVALFGSVLYLLGVVLIYGLYGVLDFAHLAVALARSPTGLSLGAALALMSAGLMAKAALFPLHFWLPPAHSGAPPAASAVLSALVIKAPLFLLVRIWTDLAPAPMATAVAPVLAVCGAGAILVCGVVALAQKRMKLLIAYSTAAQIGYLGLMFPLVVADDLYWSALAWTGGTLHLVSHAFSKAAMFMAAGLIAEALGHDRIAEFRGAARVAPLSIAAFAVGGLSLLGLPPSGGFTAKVMLLTAALQQGSWWIGLVVLGGGLLAGGYVLRPLVLALQRPDEGSALVRRECGWRAGIAFALALCAVALSFLPLAPLSFLSIGRHVVTWEGLEP